MCTVADDSLSMKHIYLQDVQRFTRMFNSCREEEESLEVAILVFGISRHLPGGAPLVPTVESILTCGFSSSKIAGDNGRMVKSSWT